VQRSDLVAALAAHRELDVVIVIDGAQFPITAVRFGADDNMVPGSGLLELHGHHEAFQICYRLDPGEADDELMPSVVHTLRDLWEDHRETRGSTAAHIDFYQWAIALLTDLYNHSFLRLPLPSDIDPNAICRCGGSLTQHRPRQDPRCIYRREVTS
jgi:hypothetical protein